MKKVIYPEDEEYENYKDNPYYEECLDCHALINFQELDGENIIMGRGGTVEYWGARVREPDPVIGFVCPECGEENLF